VRRTTSRSPRVAGLGDLGQATVGVDDLDPRGLVDARDRLPARIGLVWRTVIE
jgi:hypothetical protein